MRREKSMEEGTEVVELARRLVDIPSPTGWEGRVGAFMAERLEAAGWAVARQDLPGDRDGGGRFNVLATSGSAPPRLVFTTHLDTVPPPVPFREDEEHLYGRGTCDAKGILAAMWVAAERLRAEGYEGVALLGVVGEETDSIGAKRVGEILPAADWIIDGEPTELELVSAAKGVYLFRAEVEGVAAHSAYPERGDSAIHHLLEALHRLLSERLPSEERFGPTTVNVGRIEGGAAANVIAPHAAAEVIIRLGAPRAKVLPIVKELLGPKVRVEVRSESEPLEMHVPSGRRGRPVAFGSDVPYLSRLGTPLLVGPGSILDAHTDGEKVKKSDLEAAVELYVELGRRLLEGEKK